MKTEIGGALMRAWWQRSVSVLAIYVIALTTILSAFAAPPATSATLDPFSIICHSGAPDSAATGQTPAQQAPSKACDHCSLCLVTASLSGPDAIPAGRLAPPSVLQILRPASTAARAHFAAAPNLARGPPQRT